MTIANKDMKKEKVISTKVSREIFERMLAECTNCNQGKADFIREAIAYRLDNGPFPKSS
jgi:predicted DNA-binding protein